MNILQMHNILNDLYDRAEKFNKKLNDLHYITSFQSYNNHFININGNYYKQNYYMPVITVENKGDICFNFNSIEFEFYVTKEQMIDINLEKLINDYKNDLNIYEYKNCTIDIYKIGDSKDEILNKINNSLDDKFGISFNCSSLSDVDIIKHFRLICSLLKRNF